MRKFGSFVLGVVLLLAATAVGDAAAVPQKGGGKAAGPSIRVVGLVGDRAVPVVPGRAFAQGIHDASGGCQVDEPIGVGIEVRDPKGALGDFVTPEVTWYFDESCRAVVESIGPAVGTAAPTETASPPPGGTWVRPSEGPDAVVSLDAVNPMHAAAAHRHRGWAKSTVLEQFGVTATEVYAEMRYWQDRNKVYGGFGRDGWCYTSAWPGWRINACYYSEWNPTGPSEVRVAVIGDFENNSSPPFPDYAHRARFIAVHPDFWAAQCHVTRGVLPSLLRQWKLVCAGGRSGGY